MLRRARRLQSVFDRYCDEHNYPQFKLDKIEWRHVDYLLQLTKPFFLFTTALCKSKDVTVHNVFSIYNKLFDHLETSILRLQQKSVPWKRAMRDALIAAKTKLSAYYGKTYQEQGYLYAMSTILSPQYKLKLFSDKSWSENNYEWRNKYLEHLKEYLKDYEQRLPQDSLQYRPESRDTDASELQILLDSHQSTSNDQGLKDELTRYLEEG